MLNYNKISKTNFRTCLTFLEYEKEKALAEQRNRQKHKK